MDLYYWGFFSLGIIFSLLEYYNTRSLYSSLIVMTIIGVVPMLLWSYSQRKETLQYEKEKKMRGMRKVDSTLS